MKTFTSTMNAHRYDAGFRAAGADLAKYGHLLHPSKHHLPAWREGYLDASRELAGQHGYHIVP